jgi:hypothetical protein
VSDPAENPAPIPRPKQVTLAVALLWAGLVIGGFGNYLAMARYPELGAHPLMLIFIFAMLLLNVALIHFFSLGRNWARTTEFAFTLIGTISLLLPGEEPVPPSALENGVWFVSLALAAGALYLAFSTPGSLWFAPRDT